MNNETMERGVKGRMRGKKLNENDKDKNLD
jgi:hypothetical protein